MRGFSFFSGDARSWMDIELWVVGSANSHIKRIAIRLNCSH